MDFDARLGRARDHFESRARELRRAARLRRLPPAGTRGETFAAAEIVREATASARHAPRAAARRSRQVAYPLGNDFSAGMLVSAYGARFGSAGVLQARRRRDQAASIASRSYDPDQGGSSQRIQVALGLEGARGWPRPVVHAVLRQPGAAHPFELHGFSRGSGPRRFHPAAQRFDDGRRAGSSQKALPTVLGPGRAGGGLRAQADSIDQSQLR